MDEKRWADERSSPQQMFLWLDRLAPARTKAGRRRLRLLACGVSRHWWADLMANNSRRAIEVAERFADGLLDKDALADGYRLAFDVYHDRTGAHRGEQRTTRAAYLAFVCCAEKAVIAANSATNAFPPGDEQTPTREQGEALICHLFRCVFGNPFQKPAFNKKWRTETVTALATGIYEERAFDRLPILADALEDAGCDDPATLAHLRGPGPHCRGCWVLDLALGK